jgi:hypothetical protein
MNALVWQAYQMKCCIFRLKRISDVINGVLMLNKGAKYVHFAAYACIIGELPSRHQKIPGGNICL